MNGRRSSAGFSDDSDLILKDLDQIAEKEARNGLLQFDEVERLTTIHAPEMRIEITEELIRRLNEIAIQGIRHSAGELRNISIQITNTSHKPPPWETVPEYLAEMCTYVIPTGASLMSRSRKHSMFQPT